MRADVGTMKNIVKLYKKWRRQNSGKDLDDFAAWFLGFRFSLPGFDKSKSQLQLQIAQLALPFYSKEVNADGSTSLLAILGAVSEAERFVIDPGLVIRKAAGWRNRDLWGRTIGGAGVADLPAAFEAAERSFKSEMAALERQAMGISEADESQGDHSATNPSNMAVELIAARAKTLKGLDRQFAGRMLQAAWEIIEKLRALPFSDFGEKLEAASPSQAVGAYKAVLGHLFFTFFLPDPEARGAMARLLTDLTDDDVDDTRAYWSELEACLDKTKGEARSVAAEIAWRQACKRLASDPDAEPVAVICFVAPWQAAFDELKGEFR